MTVLVTGGAGYIGSHTAKALAKKGFRVITYDNLSRGHRWAVRWGPLVVGDLLDQKLLVETLTQYKVEAVLHFAGLALVSESVEDPDLYFRTNIEGTLSLLRSMRECDVRNIVFSSTCATYGLPQNIPIQESTPQLPVNPYGDSKLTIERCLQWLGASGRLSWTALRYFNAAGADADGEIGEEHDIETHLIPSAIQASLGQRGPLEIFGTDYPTPDGTCIRDYIHVADLAKAHVLAVERLLGGAESIALNLGTGSGYSVRKVIDMVEQISGQRVPSHVSPRRPGDPPELVADASRAQSVLQWKPECSDLETIVRSAWRWHSEIVNHREAFRATSL